MLMVRPGEKVWPDHCMKSNCQLNPDFDTLRGNRASASIAGARCAGKRNHRQGSQHCYDGNEMRWFRVLTSDPQVTGER
jgi:hypothetical protein